MAATATDDLILAVKLAFEKLKAQVPVKADELRSLWLDMVDAAKKIVPLVLSPSKEELDTALESFKSPSDNPMQVECKDQFKKIQDQFLKSGGIIDTALTMQICGFYTSKDVSSSGSQKADCRKWLLKAAEEIRGAWTLTVDEMKRTCMVATAVHRGLLAECAVLEPPFQAWLDHVDAWRQFADSIRRFAEQFS